MDKKIILGLALTTPLSALAQNYPSGLELQGTETYVDTIDIPITANKGIVITPGSNTTFKENVNINLTQYEPYVTSGEGLSALFENNPLPATTIFEGDLTINMQEPTRWHRVTGITLSGPNTVEVKGKTTVLATDDPNNPRQSYAIKLEDNSLLTLDGQADIKGNITVDKSDLIFNDESTINGDIVVETGKIEFNNNSVITGDVEASMKGIIEFNEKTKIEGTASVTYKTGKITFNKESEINDIQVERGSIILNGESNINNIDIINKGKVEINNNTQIIGDIEVSDEDSLLQINGESKIEGNITIEDSGKVEINNNTQIIGDIEVSDEDSLLQITGESEIDGGITIDESGIVKINNKTQIIGDIDVSEENSLLQITGESTITGNISIEDNGKLEINNKSTITGNIDISDENSLLLMTGDSTINGDIIIDEQGKMEINNKSKITGNIKTSLNSKLIISDESEINGDVLADTASEIEINNKSKINGNIEATNNGTVKLNLGAGAKMQASANNNIGNSNAGNIIIALAENSSWDVINNASYVTELSGNGNIKFVNTNYSSTFGELNIADLKGGVNFDMRTDITAEQNDKIIVSRSLEGTHTLNITNNGASNTTGLEKLTLVEIDNSATGTGEFRTSHAIELGGYVYNLSRDTNNNWVLTGAAIVTPVTPVTPTNPVTPVNPTNPVIPGNPTNPVTPGNPTNPVTPGNPTNPVTPGNPTNPVTPGNPTNPVTPGNPTNPVTPGNPTNPVTPGNPTNPVTPGNPTNPVTPGNPTNPVTPGNPNKPEITTTANASAGFLNANYLMSYVETQTLLKRLGDMRNSGEFGDVWMRGFSGKLDSFASGKLSKFDMNYHGFQFGADKQLADYSPFVVGAFVGQTYGDPNYRKGDGSLRSFNAGLYTSYFDYTGLYVDVVGKYARQRNHFKVRDTANNRVQGNGHTNGLGLSMELGKKFMFQRFYIEPQTQLSYSHQNGTSINATNGLRVKLGNYNSLIGRASTLLGYEVNTENSNVNLYAKTGIVREFNGDTYYKLNNSKESHSFKGNWWNNGVGVSANINHRHTIYFDLESSLGHKFDLLQVNGGYRYSF